MYAQRYLPHLPAAGEIVIFDRSWYNRAGVERVMGFCTEEEVEEFFSIAPNAEKLMVDSGVILFKYWMEVSEAEQTGASGAGSRMAARSGSSRRWISSRTPGGTTIPAPATKCSRPPTPPGRPGTSPTRTTSGGRG